MTVKPLSEKDFSYGIMSDLRGNIRDTTHMHIKWQRLKELFDELYVRRIGIRHPAYGADCIHWKDVEKLFGPLVERQPLVSDKPSVPK